jgi:two-component system sensor histidine kinase RegB
VRWWLDLRWGSVAGQAATIAAVHSGWDIELPIAPMVVVLFAYAGVNGCASYAASRTGGLPVHALGLLGFVDIVELTAMLYFAGGPYNPFTFLYLVGLSLGAMVLPTAWIWSLCAAALASYGALFWRHRGLAALLQPHHEPSLHVQGMWVAFAVAAVFIVMFANRMSRALAKKEKELAAARERAARSRQLGLLASLTAGAAHELGTPLSTIAVAARELERNFLRGSAGSAADDARLIREQVQRCQDTLFHLSAQAGQVLGEPIERVPVSRWLEEAITETGRGSRVALDVAPAARRTELRTWRRATRQALSNLIGNALDAAGVSDSVLVRVWLEPGTLCLAVEDKGAGMPLDVLSRAGEPFFTTKEEGQGMGLGLFLARSVIEHAGGTLALQSEPGRGTTALIRLPLAEADSAGSVPTSPEVNSPDAG